MQVKTDLKSTIEIIFENENFVAVNKPPLVLSVPGRDAKDERPVLGKLLEEKLNIQLYPVHRLDYEVSGLILYAKNKESHKVANKWFEDKQIFKTYKALTEMSDEAFEINKKLIWQSRLVRGKKRTFEASHGLASETHAYCMDSIELDGTLFWQWRLLPITGRSHQLRFELYKRGCPILGDILYGSKFQFNEGGIALKAIEIDLSNIEQRFGLPEKITTP